MKDKFEEAIIEQTYIFSVGGKYKIKGTSHAAKKCNTLHQQAIKEERGKILKQIPTTWLDPLLTGKTAVIENPPYNCKDIEKLLSAIKKRIEKTEMA